MEFKQDLDFFLGRRGEFGFDEHLQHIYTCTLYIHVHIHVHVHVLFEMLYSP